MDNNVRLKQSICQTTKSTKSKEMNTEKETIAEKIQNLKKPVSNWEKYKNTITSKEVVKKSNNTGNNKSETKKRKFVPMHSTNGHGIMLKKVKEYLIKYVCFIVKYIVLIIFGSQQQTNTKITTSDENKKDDKVSKGITKAVAIDCEMVGIGKGGVESMIARVSIVNKNGYCLYDKYVKPQEDVTDFRTNVSGIRPHHLANGEDFKIVQQEVADILKGRLLVGHALHNDLAVLFLSHPKKLQRDTSRYKLFKKVTKGSTPSLKKLASELLGIDIQNGEHSSIEDARAAMQLYQLYRKVWDSDRFGNNR